MSGHMNLEPGVKLPLRKILKLQLYTEMTPEQNIELIRRLRDAGIYAGRASRRAQYIAGANEVEAFLKTGGISDVAPSA